MKKAEHYLNYESARFASRVAQALNLESIKGNPIQGCNGYHHYTGPAIFGPDCKLTEAERQGWRGVYRRPKSGPIFFATDKGHFSLAPILSGERA